MQKLDNNTDESTQLSEVVIEDLFTQKIEDNFFIKMDKERQKQMNDAKRDSIGSMNNSRQSIGKGIFQNRRISSMSNQSLEAINDAPIRKGSL